MLSPDRIPFEPVPSEARTGLPKGLLLLAILIFAFALAAILGALAFEHVGGYLPCHLCLLQRTPYYVGVPVAAAAVLAVVIAAPRLLVAALFTIFAALMFYGAVLAVFHSGVEWGFWQGPASCAPSVGVTSAADMLNQLENTQAPSCTDAALRILGLSLAGWNALVSALLVVLGAAGARMAWQGA
jgi:disulfide bond formation protein DsbB